MNSYLVFHNDIILITLVFLFLNYSILSVMSETGGNNDKTRTLKASGRRMSEQQDCVI